MKVNCIHCDITLGKYFVTKNDLILGEIYLDKGKVTEINPVNPTTLIDNKIDERKKLLKELVDNRKYIIDLFEVIAKRSQIRVCESGISMKL